MFRGIVFLLVLLSNNISGPVVDHVDITELNHFYDENGRLVFDQLIYWDYKLYDDGYREEIRAWRLVKTQSQIPTRTSGKYQATWYDGEIFRKIISDSFRETWTQYDPELINRNVRPREERQELFKLPKSTGS